MVPHPDLYEKLLATHRAQIQHEIQRNRILGEVRQRRSLFRSTVSSLGTYVIVLGSYLQRMGKRRETSLHSS
jgi:hypothetical protein